ncbi:hypothetical protein ABT336_12030 [Micromonospora sp. NPDC000207]|uniref:hypothetical protein n=1 Tax=Micromonospora sp. NPDC000207 TaxID=3154246 RepID=UPI00332B662A
MNDQWTTVTAADQVTDEILEAAQDINNGWWANKSRIDWTEFLDRLEGTTLSDGTRLGLGNSMVSPAIRRIKKHIADYRKLG